MTIEQLKQIENDILNKNQNLNNHLHILNLLHLYLEEEELIKKHKKEYVNNQRRLIKIENIAAKRRNESIILQICNLFSHNPKPLLFTEAEKAESEELHNNLNHAKSSNKYQSEYEEYERLKWIMTCPQYLYHKLS